MTDLPALRAAIVGLVSLTLAGCQGGGKVPPSGGQGTEPMIEYPESPRQDVIEVLHGQPVADPYRWLEDSTRPEVQAWMQAQDRLTRDLLGKRPERGALAQRLRQLAYIDTIGTPFKRGGRYFYTRKHAGLEKAVHYWKAGPSGEERVLLDPNTLSPDGAVSVGLVVPSRDGTLAAFTLRQRGADAAVLHLMEVETGKRLPDLILGAKYAVPEWTPDGSGFYYTWIPSDPSIPVDQVPGKAEVRFHRLGTDPAADPVVYPATQDPTRFLAVQLSKDGRWLIVTDQHGWVKNDLYVRDLSDPAGGFRPLVAGREAQYSVEVWDGAFFITTNEGAPNSRVFRAAPPRLEREHWKEIIPEDPAAPLEGAAIVGGHLALQYLVKVSSALKIVTLDGKPLREVPLPGIGTTGGVSGEPDDDEAFFSFSSYTFPPAVYRASIAGGKVELWGQARVPVDPAPFTVEQVWFESRDKTRVSMFLVHRKDMKKDGGNPVILSAYGGFQVNLTPAFSAYAYLWLEKGGVWAFPNLRGGGEYGEDWHKAGMLLKKQNTFDDMISAAEWLVASRITSPGRLVIRGGSNGGLLVGAVLTQRPDLCRAVISAVPLLDMVRYHRFGSGRTWVTEYGSAEDAEQFRVLYGYSPYHRVKEGTAYPAVLFVSADNDDRVDPLHARKMAAALQAAQAAPHPILLRVERNAGHGGADLRKQEVEEWADTYSFLFWQIRR